MAISTLPVGAPVGAAAPARSRTPAASHKRDLIAVITLVALAGLVYGLPAVLGHTVVPGDDLTQNLPLRELVGRDLATGHLPVLDPYIWGGAPLLAGWNAGAAYPLTWLFAVLPGAAAWSVNLVATGAVAGTGFYAFSRASALRPLASWLGAVTFAFGGGMVAQVPHFGLIAGMSWVPAALLAVLRLTQPGGRMGLAVRLGWAAVLAVAIGLVVLAGEPRAIADAAAVVVPYVSWRLVRLALEARRQRRQGVGVGVGGGGRVGGRGPIGGGGSGGVFGSVASVVCGAAVGVGLGAVQLLPGLAAVATSQRADVTTTLFSSGSLPVPWLTLLGVPDLLGGSGSFGQPAFFANYNLTEISGYVGVLPLVAAFALLGRWWARAGWASLRSRAARKLPEWLIWHLVAALGLVLALGNHTPVWHLLIRLPLFGGQRLQSRSLLVTDLGLAVLLGWWTDGWLHGGGELRNDDGERRAGGGERRAGAVERAVASVPALAIVGVVVAFLAWRDGLLTRLGVPGHAARAAEGMWPWLLPFLGLAVVGLLLVWGGRRLRRRWRAGVLAVCVVLDLTTYAVTAVIEVGGSGGGVVAGADSGASGGASSRAQAPPSGPASGGTRPVSALGFGGRIAVYDPTLLDPSQLSRLGVPDGNVLSRTFSVQGYGSIVDGRYAAATGAHKATGTGQDDLSVSAVRGSVLDSLDTTALLVASAYLVRDQRLDAVLVPPHWERAGHDGPFVIFRDTRASAPITVRPLRGHGLGDASVRQLSGPRLEPTSAIVSSRVGVDVVRAVTAIPGWTATWRPAGGRAVTLPVRAFGVVQSVDVPAGRGTLTWKYDAPGLAAGEIVSLVSLGLVLAAAAIALGMSVHRRS